MAVQQQDANPGSYPGSPAAGAGQRSQLAGAGAQNTHPTPRRAEDQRRLRRVKDSKEQLKRRTRARGTSNGTIESISTSTAPGRSYTVANVNNGVIYLR